jgi:hypothetical protein
MFCGKCSMVCPECAGLDRYRDALTLSMFVLPGLEALIGMVHDHQQDEADAEQRRLLDEEYDDVRRARRLVRE